MAIDVAELGYESTSFTEAEIRQQIATLHALERALEARHSIDVFRFESDGRTVHVDHFEGKIEGDISPAEGQFGAPGYENM